MQVGKLRRQVFCRLANYLNLFQDGVLSHVVFMEPF